MWRSTVIAIGISLICVAQSGSAEDAAPPDKQSLYKQLEATLNGATFSGSFTVLGKDREDLAKEEYTILSATKVEMGEMWLIKAHIQYGKKDLVVPMPLEILWAGKTPVITLDKLTLPGLGTFSARVVLHDGKYAGTWQHDAVGGHLFGTIKKAKPADEKQPEEPRE